MKAQAFFALAKEAGISESQLRIGHTNSIAFSTYHHEIDSYQVNSTQFMQAAGIYNGKYGSSLTEKFGKDSFDFLVNAIKFSATNSEQPNEVGIFPGSPKYKKRNFYNKALADTPLTDKINLIKDIENRLYAASPDVSDVPEVSYSETDVTGELYNSFGLKLKQKQNYFIISAGVVVKRGEETKTSGNYIFGNDLTKIDIDEFVKKIVEDGAAQFGGVQCEAKKYPVLLKNQVFAELLSVFVEANSADEVQHHASFLEGLEGKRVASRVVNIDDKPLLPGPFYTYYDGEGVARTNQKIVNHGVLLTHFYNRETAKKAGRETTGHGSAEMGKVGVSATNIIVKPSKKTTDELIANVKEGVYITDISGLGQGLNSNSGDFSCQAQGFRIENGKITAPLDLITLAGNILQMMKDVQGFDDQYRFGAGAIGCSDALIKSMSIGGKGN